MEGMVAISGPRGDGGSACTIGHYSYGPQNYTATWKDHLFVHEYGHYIQSQFMGPFYLGIVGLPSLISAGCKGKTKHSDRWFERDANKRGGKYFNKRYGNGEGPDYFSLAAFSTSQSAEYENPRSKGYNNRNVFPIHVSQSITKWWEFCFVWL